MRITTLLLSLFLGITASVSYDGPQSPPGGWDKLGHGLTMALCIPKLFNAALSKDSPSEPALMAGTTAFISSFWKQTRAGRLVFRASLPAALLLTGASYLNGKREHDAAPCDFCGYKPEEAFVLPDELK